MSRLTMPKDAPRLEVDQRVTIGGDVPPEYEGVEAVVLASPGLRRSHNHPRSNPSMLVKIPSRGDEILSVLRSCLTPAAEAVPPEVA